LAVLPVASMDLAVAGDIRGGAAAIAIYEGGAN
jgi:hypothetical protein